MGGIVMKAWELNEVESFQQAVESAEPKLIFLKVLKVLDERGRRRDVLQMLGIDVKKSNPIYIHKHFPYKRKNYKDNMFIYIDKRYRIMGFLRGTEHETSWERLEHWDSVNNVNHQSYLQVDIVKNKKNLWEQSHHILMFDKSDLNKVNIQLYNNKRNIHDERKTMERHYRERFASKLTEYRKKKYDNLIISNSENNLDSIMWDCLMKIKELSNSGNNHILKAIRAMFDFNEIEQVRDSDLVEKIINDCFNKDHYKDYQIYIGSLLRLKKLYMLLFNKELPNSLIEKTKVKETLYIGVSETMKHQS
jgi:hypothetical protein